MEEELWNFKSQNILCAEVELQVTEYSACGISLVPYSMARNTSAQGPQAILEVLIWNKGTAFEATLHNNCVNEVYLQLKDDMNCSKLLAFN